MSVKVEERSQSIIKDIEANLSMLFSIQKDIIAKEHG